MLFGRSKSESKKNQTKSTKVQGNIPMERDAKAVKHSCCVVLIRVAVFSSLQSHGL